MQQRWCLQLGWCIPPARDAAPGECRQALIGAERLDHVCRLSPLDQADDPVTEAMKVSTQALSQSSAQPLPGRSRRGWAFGRPLKKGKLPGARQGDGAGHGKPTAFGFGKVVGPERQGSCEQKIAATDGLASSPEPCRQ